MDLELVTIGTELLLGHTVDTNGAEIARALAAQGVRIVRRTAVGDRAEDIRQAVAEALARTDAVLTTGGLGPTRDDITKTTVAELFDAPARVQRRGLAGARRPLCPAPPDAGREQPHPGPGAPRRDRAAQSLGHRPGLWLEGRAGSHDHAARRAQARCASCSSMRWCRGSALARQVPSSAPAWFVRPAFPSPRSPSAWARSSATSRPLTLAYLPGIEGVDLRASAWNLEPAEADRRLLEAVALLRERAGDHVYGEDDDRSGGGRAGARAGRGDSAW